MPVSAPSSTQPAREPAQARRAIGRPRVAASDLLTATTVVAVAAFTVWAWTWSDGLQRAEDALRRGDLARAVSASRDHLRRRPWSRPAALVAARSLSRLDFADLAEPYYRQAGRLSSDDRHVRALALVRANKRSEAEAAFRAILAENPRDPLALRRLAAELMTQSRWDDALALGRRLAEIPGARVDGLALVAAVQHQREDAEGAVVAGDEILRIDPNLIGLPSDPAYRSLFFRQYAGDLLAVGRPADAADVLERARRELGDDALHLRLLGEAYRQLTRDGDAERAWRRALELDPNLVSVWVDLGRMAMAEGRLEEAVEPLEHAAKLDPGGFSPAYNLALLFRRLGRTEDAERWRKAAERAREKSPPPMKGMGFIPGRKTP